MIDSRSTEIEEILEGSPSRFAFRLLRALLDTWPDHADRDEAIRRAGRALARWPARTRHVSVDGCGPMSALLRRPSWPLVRSLWWVALASEGDEEIDRAIADLACDPNTRQLRRLMLEYPEDEILRRLHLPTCFPKLVHLSLELGSDNRRRVVIPLLNAGLPSRLRSLTLNGTENLDEWMSDDVPDVVGAIASSPVGRRLRAVRLSNMSHATFAHFLERFRGPLADIGHQEWTVESLERVCRNRGLASGLKRLDLLARHLGPEGVAMLTRCSHLGRLEHLNLGGNSLVPDDVAVLAGSSIVSNLRWLNLFDNPLGDEGWEILSRAPFRRLRTLALCYTGATALGARSFARTRSLGRLRSLILNGNPVGDEGLSEILGARFATRLRYLNMAATGKSAATAEVLASRPLGCLRALDFGSDAGGPDFGRQLARSSVFPSLTSLDLQGLDLGDEGVESLAGATGFPRLRRLFLQGNDLTSRGIRALAASPFVSSIRDLSLQANPEIDDAGAIALAESRFLRNLVSLDLNWGWNKVSQEGPEILRRSPNMSLLDRSL